jgi:hypothetical protein
MVEPAFHQIRAAREAVVEGFGAVVELSADERGLVAVRSGLPDGVTVREWAGARRVPRAVHTRIEATTGRDGIGEVRVDGTLVGRVEAGAFIGRIVSEVHSAIAQHAQPWVFVHAGVVAWQGVGIVIPGRSLAGKSSLVRVLVERGATYLSDEYAVLDSTGSVWPYAKSLSVRRADGRVESIAPASMGEVGTGPVPVGVVVSVRYRPSARWDPQPLVGAAAVLPLVDNTVVARLRPESTLDAATAIVRRGGRCLQGERPDAHAIADDLLRRAASAAGAVRVRDGNA